MQGHYYIYFWLLLFCTIMHCWSHSLKEVYLMKIVRPLLGEQSGAWVVVHILNFLIV